MSSQYESYMLRHGRSLAQIGLPSEFALTIGDAKDALGLAEDCGRVVLGGDVYYLRDSTIEPAYANWHVDRRETETESALVLRSCEQSRDYLNSLEPAPPGSEYLIVIVTKVSRADSDNSSLVDGRG